jgi:hypothetical protein
MAATPHTLNELINEIGENKERLHNILITLNGYEDTVENLFNAFTDSEFSELKTFEHVKIILDNLEGFEIDGAQVLTLPPPGWEATKDLWMSYNKNIPKIKQTDAQEAAPAATNHEAQPDIEPTSCELHNILVESYKRGAIKHDSPSAWITKVPYAQLATLLPNYPLANTMSYDQALDLFKNVGEAVKCKIENTEGEEVEKIIRDEFQEQLSAWNQNQLQLIKNLKAGETTFEQAGMKPEDYEIKIEAKDNSGMGMRSEYITSDLKPMQAVRLNGPYQSQGHETTGNACGYYAMYTILLALEYRRRAALVAQSSEADAESISNVEQEKDILSLRKALRDAYEDGNPEGSMYLSVIPQIMHNTETLLNHQNSPHSQHSVNDTDSTLVSSMVCVANQGLPVGFDDIQLFRGTSEEEAQPRYEYIWPKPMAAQFCAALSFEDSVEALKNIARWPAQFTEMSQRMSALKLQGSDVESPAAAPFEQLVVTVSRGHYATSLISINQGGLEVVFKDSWFANDNVNTVLPMVHFFSSSQWEEKAQYTFAAEYLRESLELFSTNTGKEVKLNALVQLRDELLVALKCLEQGAEIIQKMPDSDGGGKAQLQEFMRQQIEAAQTAVTILQKKNGLDVETSLLLNAIQIDLKKLGPMLYAEPIAQAEPANAGQANPLAALSALHVGSVNAAPEPGLSEGRPLPGESDEQLALQTPGLINRG